MLGVLAIKISLKNAQIYEITQLYLFIEEMIAYIENKKHPKELLELIKKQAIS